jgi:hypothetical protein
MFADKIQFTMENKDAPAHFLVAAILLNNKIRVST